MKALLHGLPVLVLVALIVLVYRRGGTNRTVYRLPEPWTHSPILWSATDEVVPGGSHAGHHGSHEAVSVGGGASGHW